MKMTIVVICMCCKKIISKTWGEMPENFDGTEMLSHGICEKCLEKQYPKKGDEHE